MIKTRWIVHCDSCGYLLDSAYPAQWAPDRSEAHNFHHKKEAVAAVQQYSRYVREHLLVEHVTVEKDAIFD
jgi:hypothetical protein